MSANTLNGMHRQRTIDWKTVHKKMEYIQAAAAQEVALTAQEKQALLKVRAQALARTQKKAEATGIQVEIMEFLLADGTYAFESASVREVYPLKVLTPLPCTPSFILGVMNVRGRILPVIDVKPLLDLPEKQANELSKTIILQTEGMEVGILTDTVLGVRVIPINTLHPPLLTLTGLNAQYLKGVTHEGVVILDAHRLLTRTRLSSQE